MNTIHHLSKGYVFAKKKVSNILAINFYKIGTRREYNIEKMISLCAKQKIKQFSCIWHAIKARNMSKFYHFLHIHVNDICGFYFAIAKKIDDDDQLIMSLLGKE